MGNPAPGRTGENRTENCWKQGVEGERWGRIRAWNSGGRLDGKHRWRSQRPVRGGFSRPALYRMKIYEDYSRSAGKKSWRFSFRHPRGMAGEESLPKSGYDFPDSFWFRKPVRPLPPRSALMTTGAGTGSTGNAGEGAAVVRPHQKRRRRWRGGGARLRNTIALEL